MKINHPMRIAALTSAAILWTMPAAGAALNGGAAAVVKVVSIEQLAERARAARTAEEHHAVADGYQKLASQQRERAERHEQEAERLAPRGFHPMLHKWPGLALAPANRERARAMQARRAANEAMQLAEIHRERARENAAAAE